MAMVEWQKDGSVALMIMNNGENRQNLEWAEAMMSVYEEIAADQEVKALVLTSSDPKNFSQGVDVQWMGQKLQEQAFPTINKWLATNHQVFTAMMMAPFPTIAAITGHAYGNGALLAGACDFRFMRSDRGYFCLPEIDLGIQFIPSQIEWMRRIMPYHFLQRLQLSGDRVGAEELEKYNAILKACPDRETTIAEAVAYGKTFDKSRVNMAEMKRRVYRHVLEVIEHVDPPYMVLGAPK
ncbi:MAG: enoyl-CoA hydratase/isomerase family protein [Syntrophomonadaceae bacterium]|nr:enoyl-CoA hydratase/isomerase family protein [Syntrophomonadaceae bacterium]